MKMKMTRKTMRFILVLSADERKKSGGTIGRIGGPQPSPSPRTTFFSPPTPSPPGRHLSTPGHQPLSHRQPVSVMGGREIVKAGQGRGRVKEE